MAVPFEPEFLAAKSLAGKSLAAKSPAAKSWAAKSLPPGPTRRTAVGLILSAPLLGACAGVQQSLSQFSSPFGGSQPEPAGPPQQPLVAGKGQVKVGLICRCRPQAMPASRRYR